MSHQATLQIDGIDIHVEGQGQDTIVMIHGWPDTYRLWDASVEHLKPHFRCVRFTLPGFDVHGPRRAWSLDELVTFFRKVVEATAGGRPVTLMLHDWGCVFGYQFWMRHPQLVGRVIGVDVGDGNSPEYRRSLSGKAKSMIFIYQAWLALAWRIGGRAGDRMTHWLVRKVAVPSDPRFISERMNYPYYIRWTGAYGSYRRTLQVKPTCPMLFIYGALKPFTFHSPQWVQALATRPGSRVLPFETRHWVMLEKPSEFNEAVLAWLLERH